MMNENDLKNCIINISNDNDGFNFICFLLDELKPFERGFIQDTNLQNYLKGKKDFAIFILELIQKYNFEKYIQIMEKRSKNL